MRLICAMLVLIICLTAVVSAGDIIINEGNPLEDNPIEPEVTIDPKVTETPVAIETPVVIETPVAIETPVISLDKKAVVEYVAYEKSIIRKVMELFGLIAVEKDEEVLQDTLTVIVNGNQVASIPKESKFAGSEVHEFCLQYQYGTDAWRTCEETIG